MLKSQKIIHNISLPPSAQKVISFIEENGPKTSKELMNGIGMSKRTLRYALRILTEEDIVKRVPVLTDMRKVRYKL